jgi:hypothetical protein
MGGCMEMTIAFFTEMPFQGKISRTHENMRTEFAWMCTLEADHYNLNDTPDKHYDLGIIINSKKNPEWVNVNKLKRHCDKVAVMQEGPHWYFQDYPLPNQIQYFNNLIDADRIYVHNESDKKYYQGLTGKDDVRVMKSLMIHDAIGELADVDRKGVIIGGNFVSWYGGFDSMIIAQTFDDTIYAPTMGRRSPGEDQLITHLPYMNWKQWIHKLNEFKYAVHLMRTHAAGTFALNCAYLGIPCIGYRGLDTQEICHPDCTVELGDITSAKQIAEKLRNDEEFYLYCSNKCKEAYGVVYHESNFKI